MYIKREKRIEEYKEETLVLLIGLDSIFQKTLIITQKKNCSARRAFEDTAL
jgi:hypothetical protein